MKDADPHTIYLADYQPFPFAIDSVALTFKLDGKATRVLSRIAFRPIDPDSQSDLFLHGENLTLLQARINGRSCTPQLSDAGLTIPASDLPDGPFIWESEVEIDPTSNTALEGLYMSNGMYCTQCEAEGFRKITYYPDRPDVMAVFTVRIEGSPPVLLSNGNPANAGPGWAEWHDPWPKPAYLFALVGGDLVAHSGAFTTMTGRDVALNIWVRRGDEDKCAYALDALIRSMKWDEDTYGRVYDLDVFNIVAVDDFNMGAMENKGLNIFNSKYVLASPETATDTDYEYIEGIIAHEYFHNWTGNRITCRDWFQLSLKEGLTVFRDQQFSGDMRSHAVKRIAGVLQLRARQFREDNGPLSHPVRPESFVEINNFYTATVYEKGAEVINMLKHLVGDDGYAQALDLYFERHDGDAATIEDWLAVFQDATGRDLSQFKRWYSQAGTPRVAVEESYDHGRYTLTLSQSTPPTPGQKTKEPQHIPVAVGLLTANGDEAAPTQILELTEARQTFQFDGLAGKPVASILRGFSAPVILERQSSPEQRAFLLAHDTDPFNQWEAGRSLAKDAMIAMIVDDTPADPGFLDGLANVFANDALDPAFRALILQMPSQEDLAQTLFDAQMTPDPIAIHHASQKMRAIVADRLAPMLMPVYNDMQVDGPYSPDARAAGQRALRQSALSLMSEHDNGQAASAQFAAADNMTEQLGALGCLLRIGQGDHAVQAFYDRWSQDRLVMDKWFMMQVMHAAPQDAVNTTKSLTAHSDFDWKNPNRFRSVLGALSANPAGFHDPTGAGYTLFADWLIRLDPLNPQTTARMCGAFETWRRYDGDRQGLISAEIQRVLATPNLSRDTTEMLTRILG